MVRATGVCTRGHSGRACSSRFRAGARRRRRHGNVAADRERSSARCSRYCARRNAAAESVGRTRRACGCPATTHSDSHRRDHDKRHPAPRRECRCDRVAVPTRAPGSGALPTWSRYTLFADRHGIRTCTRLSSNLNRQRPTISVPFSVLPTATFAQRLRKARIEAGLTQKELSSAAGLSKDLVWRWETEKHGGRRGSLERVGGVLGVVLTAAALDLPGRRRNGRIQAFDTRHERVIGTWCTGPRARRG